ncbi:MAG: beta-lactamase family protein [Myxococcales bacterium]|nr:beta-lactamase family protein [Myxococcales bacterium]
MIHGTVAPKFAPVKAVLERHFAEMGEVGASICVIHEGETVVDLWGGIADQVTGTPWQADTLVNTFSVTKGAVAHALLRLEDRGELNLDDRVSEHWPEFAANGKASITLRQVLNHTSGVIAIDRPLSLDDVLAWEPVERALAAQAPLWEPGTAQGYHAVTWGMMVRAIVPRIVGRSVGTVLAEIAEPLGADVFVGLPESELPRCATLVQMKLAKSLSSLARAMVVGGLDGNFFRNTLLRRNSPGARAVANPKSLGALGLTNFDRKELRMAELPWANLHASARGLARLYAPLAGDGEAFGVRTVSPEAAARPKTPQSWAETDLTLRKPLGFSQGFLKEQPTLFSPNPGWLGHSGTGGALGYADPDAQLSLGYTINRMRPNLRSPTALELSRTVYACLGTPVKGQG